MTLPRPRRMTLGAMLAYGSGDFYGGGALYIITTLYGVFLTTVVGLTPVQAGSILLGGKVWAAIANPLVGYLSDRTQSRWGRRRVYFLIGLVPMFALLWIPVRPFAFHCAAYLLFDTFFTLVKVPYNSILPEMTTDYTERTRATGFRMMFSQGSSILGAFLPLSLIAWAGGGGRGYLVMGLVFGCLFTLPWLANFLCLWERESEPSTSRLTLAMHARALRKGFLSTLRNRSFVIHMGMYLTAFLNLDTFNGLVVFYATCWLGRDMAWARWLMTVVQASQLLMLPLATVLCYRIGNAATYRVSLAVWGSGILLLATQAPDVSDRQLLACAVVIGIGLSGAILTPWNIQTFMADVDELMTTRRREGVYAGFMQFARQLAIGHAMFANNLVLSHGGFVSGATVQPPQVGASLHHYLMWAPVVVLGTGILLSVRFRLDPVAHGILLQEIERLKAGGDKRSVDEHVKKVCETLTGQPYHTLWDPTRAQ